MHAHVLTSVALNCRISGRTSGYSDPQALRRSSMDLWVCIRRATIDCNICRECLPWALERDGEDIHQILDHGESIQSRISEMQKRGSDAIETRAIHNHFQKKSQKTLPLFWSEKNRRTLRIGMDARPNEVQREGFRTNNVVRSHLDNISAQRMKLLLARFVRPKMMNVAFGCG